MLVHIVRFSQHSSWSRVVLPCHLRASTHIIPRELYGPHVSIHLSIYPCMSYPPSLSPLPSLPSLSLPPAATIPHAHTYPSVPAPTYHPPHTIRSASGARIVLQVLALRCDMYICTHVKCWWRVGGWWGCPVVHTYRYTLSLDTWIHTVATGGVDMHPCR